jgi:hypothetical protein
LVTECDNPALGFTNNRWDSQEVLGKLLPRHCKNNNSFQSSGPNAQRLFTERFRSARCALLTGLTITASRLDVKHIPEPPDTYFTLAAASAVIILMALMAFATSASFRLRISVVPMIFSTLGFHFSGVTPTLAAALTA